MGCEKSMRSLPKIVVWLGILTILVTGIVHFMDAPDSMSDVAYKGMLFYANGIGALVAAWGIFRNRSMWGWHLGALVAGLAFVGYIASRTIGLPMLPPEPDAWLEPMGEISLVAEAGFLAIYGWVLIQGRHSLTTVSG